MILSRPERSPERLTELTLRSHAEGLSISVGICDRSDFDPPVCLRRAGKLNLTVRNIFEIYSNHYFTVQFLLKFPILPSM